MESDPLAFLPARGHRTTVALVGAHGGECGGNLERFFVRQTVF
jgi:hypothetical protein